MSAYLPTEPETERLVRLGVVVARLSRSFRVAVADHGLTPSALSVLATVVRLGPLGMTSLAERERLHPTLLSRITRTLEQAGLLTRAQATEDRRCIVVGATDAGRDLQARMRSERTAALTRGMDVLDPDEVALVLSAVPALERLAGLGWDRDRA